MADQEVDLIITAAVVAGSIITVVVEAEDSRTAFEAAQASLPDIILLDLSIPAPGGIETTQRIKREVPSTGIIALARVPGRLFQGCNESLLVSNDISLVLTMIFVMTAGTGVIMWLGENITDKGVGNGMSLLIFTSIIATFPGQLWQIGTINGAFTLLLVLLVGVFIIVTGVAITSYRGMAAAPLDLRGMMIEGNRQCFPGFSGNLDCLLLLAKGGWLAVEAGPQRAAGIADILQRDRERCILGMGEWGGCAGDGSEEQGKV